MKFLHTADLHLGKSFSIVGEKGSKLREAQLSTLERIVDLAKAEVVDFIAIAGDLFDSNEVTARLIKKAVDLLKRIDPIPVLILPGTHDLLEEGSIYQREEFREALNISVFGIDGITIKVKDVTVHGRANDTKQGGVRPLKELSPDPNATYNVAVIHASVEIEGKSSPDDCLVSRDEIASSGMDYIALGHWHKKSDFSINKVKAWYCGAPEVTKFDEASGAGHILLISLGEDETIVEAKQVGKFKWLDMSIDISACPTGDSLNSEINALKGEDVLLRLRLKGTLPRGQEIDPDVLEEDSAEGFFHFEVDTSKVGYPIEEVDNLFAEGTIGSIYISRLRELIEGAETKEEKALLEKALYLGSSYISGELEVG